MAYLNTANILKIEYLSKFKSEDVVWVLWQRTIGDAYAQNKQPEEAFDIILKAVAANNNDFTTPRFIKSR
jgi:hypothetical protein